MVSDTTLQALQSPENKGSWEIPKSSWTALLGKLLIRLHHQHASFNSKPKLKCIKLPFWEDIVLSTQQTLQLSALLPREGTESLNLQETESSEQSTHLPVVSQPGAEQNEASRPPHFPVHWGGGLSGIRPQQQLMQPSGQLQGLTQARRGSGMLAGGESSAAGGTLGAFRGRWHV